MMMDVVDFRKAYVKAHRATLDALKLRNEMRRASTKADEAYEKACQAWDRADKALKAYMEAKNILEQEDGGAG